MATPAKPPKLKPSPSPHRKVDTRSERRPKFTWTNDTVVFGTRQRIPMRFDPVWKKAIPQAARLQHTDSLAGAADIAAVADAVELRNEAITSKVNTTSSHKVTSSQIFDNLQAQINVLTAEVRQLRREMHCQVESAVRQAVGSDLTRYQAIRTTNYSTPANIPALRSRRIHTVPVFYMDEDDTELNSFSNNRFRLPEESPAQERAKKRRGGAEESAPPSKRINIKTPSQYLDAPPRRFLSVARKRSFIPSKLETPQR